MALLDEIVLLADAAVRVTLHDDLRYRLSYGELVVYENGRRCIRGRALPYEMRSVEQLRYDFERDVEALGGKLEAYYFALGEHDVVAILDLPDTVSATALALTVSGTGLVRTKTTVLMTVEETDKALAKKVTYRGPGK